jgi:hypothetical protein
MALGGHGSGSNWLAKCPAHDDRTPSLSVSDGENGRALIHCFAGCEARDIIAALKARGLWDTSLSRLWKPMAAPKSCSPHEGAIKLWDETVEAAGTPVELYLRNRGIKLPLPQALRFHPSLWHKSRRSCPAMVALVTNASNRQPMAIHRTYLDPAGSKANLAPNKMMLGRTSGGIVCLGQGEGGLLIGEGIETVLSAMQASGRPGWAALSTSGLKSLDLPPSIRAVTILVDGDKPGRDAASIAANKWSALGVQVRMARAPEGRDFNDLIQAPSSSNGTRFT